VRWKTDVVAIGSTGVIAYLAIQVKVFVRFSCCRLQKLLVGQSVAILLTQVH
jgi:hypothetical protein